MKKIKMSKYNLEDAVFVVLVISLVVSFVVLGAQKHSQSNNKKLDPQILLQEN